MLKGNGEGLRDACSGPAVPSGDAEPVLDWEVEASPDGVLING